jgi:hypothetical protein
LKFSKSRIFTDGQVRSCSRCSLEVSLQDGRTLVGGNFFEFNLLTTAASKDRSSCGCTYVLYPVRVISKHGYRLPLSIDDGHDHWQRDHPP